MEYECCAGLWVRATSGKAWCLTGLDKVQWRGTSTGIVPLVVPGGD